MKFIIVLIIAVCAYFAYNSITSFSKDAAVDSMKNMKIITTVNDGRAKVNADVENVGNDY